jgi:hypothetical protein
MEPFGWLILLMGTAIIAAYFYVKRRQQAALPDKTESKD